MEGEKYFFLSQKILGATYQRRRMLYKDFIYVDTVFRKVDKKFMGTKTFKNVQQRKIKIRILIF